MPDNAQQIVSWRVQCAHCHEYMVPKIIYKKSTPIGSCCSRCKSQEWETDSFMAEYAGQARANDLVKEVLIVANFAFGLYAATVYGLVAVPLTVLGYYGIKMMMDRFYKVN